MEVYINSIAIKERDEWGREIERGRGSCCELYRDDGDGDKDDSNW